MSRDQNEPEHSTSRKELLDRIGPESSRRGVLRGAAVAVVGGLAGVVGLSGSAAGNDGSGQAAVRATFREHGGDLLAELADRGFLERPSVEDLQRAGRLAPAGRGLRTTYRTSGPAATAVRELDDGRQLVARVDPHADRQYALVKPPGRLSEGDSVTVLAETEDGWQTATSDVGTEGTYCDTDCYDGVCGCYEYYIDQNFQTCYSTPTQCGACYSYCPY